MRELLRYVQGNRGVLFVATVLTLLGSAAGLAQPLAAKAVLDALAQGNTLLAPLLVLGALVVAGAVVNGLGSWYLERAAERVVLVVRRGLAARLLRLRVAELDAHAPGDLVSRATADTTLLRSAASAGLVQLITGALGLVGAIVLMAVLNALLLTITLGVLVVVAVLVLVVLPRIKVAARRAQDAVGSLGAALDRALGAARTVKASGAEARETARIDAASDLAYRAGLRQARYTTLVSVISELSVQVSFLVVLGVGGALVALGTIPVSTLIAFLLYVFYLTGPIASLVAAATLLQEGLGAVSRIGEVDAMAVEPDVDREGAGPAGPPPRIDVEGVSFAYPGRPPVLREVSFSAPAGARTAIVGLSGAGKTTLFALLVRFFEPTAGRIAVDGVDIATMSRAEVRRRIGLVEQDAPVLAGTLGENLRYAAPEATEAELADVLCTTRLDELVSQLPDGLDTQVGARGSTLSGGERQRLAIARALLRRPQVLLLDEATSQLDARNEAALREAVADAARRCTVLLIAHRLSTVTAADRIVVLDAGRVRATGTHGELVGSDPLYRELAATQLLTPTEEAAADEPAGSVEDHGRTRSPANAAGSLRTF